MAQVVSPSRRTRSSSSGLRRNLAESVQCNFCSRWSNAPFAQDPAVCPHIRSHTLFLKKKNPSAASTMKRSSYNLPTLKSSGNCEQKHRSERNCSFSGGAWGMREPRGCYSRKSDYGDAAAHMQPSCATLQMIVTERRIGLRDARVPAQIGLHPSAVPQLSPCGNKTSAWTSQRLTNDTRWLQLLIWNIPIRLPHAACLTRFQN